MLICTWLRLSWLCSQRFSLVQLSMGESCRGKGFKAIWSGVMCYDATAWIWCDLGPQNMFAFLSFHLFSIQTLLMNMKIYFALFSLSFFEHFFIWQQLSRCFTITFGLCSIPREDTNTVSVLQSGKTQFFQGKTCEKRNCLLEMFHEHKLLNFDIFFIIKL